MRPATAAPDRFTVGTDGGIPLMTGVTEAAVETLVRGKLDQRTLDALDRRSASAVKSRGALVRRALIIADVVGLSLAFLVTEKIFGSSGSADTLTMTNEYLVFVATLPLWLVFAKLYRLYDHDEERADHTTLEDLLGVFHLVTVGAFLLVLGSWLAGTAYPNLDKLATFWAAAVALIVVSRATARCLCRRSPIYLQNTVVVGAGEVGQLVARKLRMHQEYGINLIGLVDGEPRRLREDLAGVPVLGSPADLPAMVRGLQVDRVVIAFSNERHADTLDLIASLRDLDVQIDIVPRLYEGVGPHTKLYTVETLPLLGLPTIKRFPASAAIKRVVDVAGATALLIATAPIFAVAAWRIRRESPGPVFFRQTRLGQHQREFTLLKFRTMRVGVDDAEHREYIKATMSSSAVAQSSGLYKLEREDAVTPFGARLRQTSLDELPQLINVLRGEMSLVGPRPCLAYEVEHFRPHHFERFRVPGGLTGLWQVSARAHSTFGEALDMDVTYARSWSLGLDLWLLLRTPLHILRRKGTR
jgi:exopolysaccharide biosynthesis polyprenyl glycosylphosphotransferase